MGGVWDNQWFGTCAVSPHRVGRESCNLRGVLQSIAQWGFCGERKRLLTAAVILKKQTEGKNKNNSTVCAYQFVQALSKENGTDVAYLVVINLAVFSVEHTCAAPPMQDISCFLFSVALCVYFCVCLIQNLQIAIPLFLMLAL